MRLRELFSPFFSAFAAARSGNVALIFGLLAPGIAILMAGGATYANAVMMRSRLQATADRAALSAAHELGVASPDTKIISRLAKNYVTSALGAGSKARIETTTSREDASVTVRIEQDAPALFGSFLPFKKTPVRVAATAKMIAGVQPCLLGLARDEPVGLAIDGATLLARGCAVHSSARAPGGVTATGGAKITARSICSAGGFSGPSGGFTPPPTTDCPVREDPFISRPPPPVGACTQTAYTVSSGTVSLSPGVYCGGLKVTGGATVTLNPGLYVIKDGPLTVENGAALIANEAGFFLTGANATLSADETTRIRLTAPRNGPLAGMLFYEDRNAPEGQTHLMGSRDAAELLGTFYLPRNRLVVGYPPTGAGSAAYTCRTIICPPPTALAATSAWTIVVARQVYVNGGLEFVLNSNYFGGPIRPPQEVVRPAMALVK